MGLDALAFELAQRRVQAPLKPDEPVRAINFTDDRALFYVLVSKRVYHDGAYEIALTKAMNET